MSSRVFPLTCPWFAPPPPPPVWFHCNTAGFSDSAGALLTPANEAVAAFTGACAPIASRGRAYAMLLVAAMYAVTIPLVSVARVELQKPRVAGRAAARFAVTIVATALPLVGVAVEEAAASGRASGSVSKGVYCLAYMVLVLGQMAPLAPCVLGFFALSPAWKAQVYRWHGEAGPWTGTPSKGDPETEPRTDPAHYLVIAAIGALLVPAGGVLWIWYAPGVMAV